MAQTNAYKVRLRSVSGEGVYFDTSPELSEQRTVNYSTVEPIHAPGAIAAFRNTSSRTFNISNARFISRTRTEASRNLQRLQLLRAWCTPRFGTMTEDERSRALRQIQDKDPAYANSNFEDVFNSQEFGIELVGAPPEVLYFSAYSSSSNFGTLQHISNVPTVIQSLSINYPTDVDYIPTLTNVPMPTVMSIDLTLMETHAPAEYQTFDLLSFKKGTLRNF